MKTRSKALIATLWTAFSACAALLGRASALIPFGPVHSFYEHAANLGALKFFLLLMSPMLFLIFADVLSHKLEKR